MIFLLKCFNFFQSVIYLSLFQSTHTYLHTSWISIWRPKLLTNFHNGYDLYTSCWLLVCVVFVIDHCTIFMVEHYSVWICIYISIRYRSLYNIALSLSIKRHKKNPYMRNTYILLVKINSISTINHKPLSMPYGFLLLNLSMMLMGF